MNLLNKLDLNVVTGGSCYCIDLRGNIFSEITRVDFIICKNYCCQEMDKGTGYIKSWINTGIILDDSNSCN